MGKKCGEPRESVVNVFFGTQLGLNFRYHADVSCRVCQRRRKINPGSGGGFSTDLALAEGGLGGVLHASSPRREIALSYISGDLQRGNSRVSVRILVSRRSGENVGLLERS